MTDSALMVEERLDRVLTQYRESPRLLFLIKTYLKAVSDTHSLISDLPDKFDVDKAVGDQLTLVGKRLGWPRCHRACDTQPVFGFECENEINLKPVAGFGDTTPSSNFGFCDDSVSGFAETTPVSWSGRDSRDFSEAAVNSTWDNCSPGVAELCINDDEIYRKFLKVRLYQTQRFFDLQSLNDSVKVFFGQQAGILHQGQGRVVIAPNRELNEAEISLLKLYPRVLPIALGVRVMFHFGELKVFGFGDGWGGFANDHSESYETESYVKTGKIFGFCDGYGGFCEDWLPDGLPLITENDNEITNETGESILTGSLTEHATWLCRKDSAWMCEIDVKPYDC